MRFIRSLTVVIAVLSMLIGVIMLLQLIGSFFDCLVAFALIVFEFCMAYVPHRLRHKPYSGVVTVAAFILCVLPPAAFYFLLISIKWC